jgi:hypothetical protein
VSSTAAGRIAATGRERTLYATAALSLLAGLIHLWVTPEHFEEWWGYGVFFLVAAAAQILYVPIVLLLPTRIVLLLGIAGNLVIVGLYLLTRTVGIPFFGPEAGEVERFGFVDVCHGIRAGHRGGAGRSAIAQRFAREKAYDRTHRGRRAGLGRARGAPSAACLLSLDSRVWASAAIGHLPVRTPVNTLQRPSEDVD